MSVYKEKITLIDKRELLSGIAENMQNGGNIVCLGNFLDKDLETFFFDLRSSFNLEIYRSKPSESVSKRLWKVSNIDIIGLPADTAKKEYEFNNKKVDLLCIDLTSDFHTIIKSFNLWIDALASNSKILLFGCELLNDGGLSNFNSYVFVNLLYSLKIIDEGCSSSSLLSAKVKRKARIEHKDVSEFVFSIANRVAIQKQYYSHGLSNYMRSGFSNIYMLDRSVYSQLQMGNCDLELDKLTFAYIMEQIITEDNFVDMTAEYIRGNVYNIETMNVIYKLRANSITLDNIVASKHAHLSGRLEDDFDWLYGLIEFEKLKLSIMLPIVNNLFDICRVNIEVLNEVINSYRFIHDNNVDTVAIFGACPTGEAYKEFYENNGIGVKLYIDNYFEVGNFKGIPVVKPSALKQLESDIDLIVLASACRKKEMKKQLSELGVHKLTYPYIQGEELL